MAKKAQASMEVFLYFGLLMLLLGGLLIWVLDFMKVKTTIEQAITLYLFEIELSSTFEKIAQLGPTSYLRLYLPPHLLGRNYTVWIKYDSTAKLNVASIEFGEDNESSYGFLIRTDIPIIKDGSTAGTPIQLISGKHYILYHKVISSNNKIVVVEE